MTIGCIQTPRAAGQKTEWERIKHTKVRTLRVEALPRLGQQDETYKQTEGGLSDGKSRLPEEGRAA